MSPDVVTATPDEPISHVARRMAEHHVHRIIVVGESRQVVGVVTSIDVLAVFPH